MKTIYLKDEQNNWRLFEYNNLSELESDFKRLNITVGKGAKVGEWATVGEGAIVGEWAIVGEGATVGEGAKVGEGAIVGEGATVGKGAKVGEWATVGKGAIVGEGATVDIYNAMFALNLYKYAVSAYNSENVEWIQLGCFLRTRKDWDNNFWNNEKEFPNDGSEKSNARLRAYKIACCFLDSIKTK